LWQPPQVTRVLALQLPAGQVVIEALLAALDRRPAHQIEAAALVLLVADLALLPGDEGRRVEALVRGDLRAEVLVVVAAEALRVRDVARAVDVAVVAVVRVVERPVARRERARRGREEIVGRRGAAEAEEDHGGSSEADRESEPLHHFHFTSLHETTKSRCALPRTR
jgi:hypothetical protein